MAILSPTARALLIPLMLLGALIFSRAMWALVDVLSPPLVGVGGGIAAGGSPAASPPPMLSRLEGGGVRGSGDGFKPPGSGHRRGSSQELTGSSAGGGDVAVGSCPVCAATAAGAAAAGSAGAWNGGGGGGGGTTFGDHHHHQRPLSAERGGRLDQGVVVSPAVSRGAPPTPTATLIEDGGDETDDGEEDDGWVSEDEGTVRRGSKPSTAAGADVADDGADSHLGSDGVDVVDPSSSVVADDGGTAAQTDPSVLGGSGDRDGGAVVDMDAAPSVRRSWSSGGVWKGGMSPEEQAEQAAAAAAAAAASAEALQQRRAAAAARFRARQLDAHQAAREAEESERREEQEEEEQEEEGDGESEVESVGRYSHQPGLASIGEGDEEDDDESSEYDSEGKVSSGARAAAAGAEEERALTADEFIVKR